MMHHDMTSEMQECLDACNACRDACLVSIAHVTETGAPLATPELMSALLDCAAICETAGNFLARGSSRHSHVCAVCAHCCRECETLCRRYPDSSTLSRCAEACARCAQTCEVMAHAAA